MFNKMLRFVLIATLGILHSEYGLLEEISSCSEHKIDLAIIIQQSIKVCDFSCFSFQYQYFCPQNWQMTVDFVTEVVDLLYTSGASMRVAVALAGPAQAIQWNLDSFKDLNSLKHAIANLKSNVQNVGYLNMEYALRQTKTFIFSEFATRTDAEKLTIILTKENPDSIVLEYLNPWNKPNADYFGVSVFPIGVGCSISGYYLQRYSQYNQHYVRDIFEQRSTRGYAVRTYPELEDSESKVVIALCFRKASTATPRTAATRTTTPRTAATRYTTPSIATSRRTTTPRTITTTRYTTPSIATSRRTTTPRTITTTKTTTPRRTTRTTTTATQKTTTRQTTTTLYTSSNGETSNPNHLDTFTCTFETSICGATIEGSDYTWSRLRGGTPTSGTGPDRGDKESLYYLYTEATDKTAGDITRFVLPNLWGGQVCLSFSAHMFGEEMGKLTVITQRGYTGRIVKIFEQSGNQNNSWIYITINFDIQETNSKIAFEAERGSGYRSDIAIDNVHLKKGYCNSGMDVTIPDQSATAMDKDIFSCDFETGVCGASLEGSDFIWSRHTGSTPSSGTGPYGGNGGSLFYLYTEATDRATGDKAMLVIQRIGTGQVCLRFFVHMYGEEMGKLLLYTTDFDREIVTKIWELSGDQGNRWKHIETTFYINSHDSKLIFEAERGNGYRSDIAIDNIRVSRGYCSNGENTPAKTTDLPHMTSGSYGMSGRAFSCDFEYGLCEITQDKQDEFDWRRHAGETPTWDTGPSSGYNSLYYLYAEVSNYSPGDRARIVIDIRAFTGDICLSFFYHMYGKDIGKLTLFWKRKNINEANEIWSKSGNQGNTWFKLQQSLRLQQMQEEIGFQSTRGQGNEGDIAIDNIVIKKGMCEGDRPSTQMPDHSVFTCGEPTVSPKISRVVGGEEAIPYSWPWMALVNYRNSFCGGSLIANNWVLTAAHCLPRFHTDMYITLGLHNRFDASNAVQIKVLQMIPHPGHDKHTRENDIMLLKLEKSVTFGDTISIVCLPNPGHVTFSGTTCVSTGWGHTNGDGTSTTLLHQVAINLISKNVCNGPDWYNGDVGLTMLCAGHQYGGKDTCQGDSGGPLVVKENGRWIIVGIVSWGEGCGDENKPGVYSDVAHNLNWILQNMT